MNNMDGLTELFIALDKMPKVQSRSMKTVFEKEDIVDWLMTDVKGDMERTMIEDRIAGYLDEEGLTDSPQFKYAYDYNMLDNFREEQNIGKWFWVLVPGKLKASGKYDTHIANLRKLGSKRGYFTYVLQLEGIEYVAYLNDKNNFKICNAARTTALALANSKAFLLGDARVQAQFNLFHCHAESMGLII